MSDVLSPGAGPGQIEDKGATEPTPDKPVAAETVDVKAVIAAAIDENNRKWQSKFDTVLGEKKAVEGKALTVEQQIEQLRQEREAERLGFVRDKAKMSAKIDDELDGAIRLYGSGKAEEIAEGAAGIRAFFDKMTAAHEADKQKAIEEALAKAGAQPRPKAGKDARVLKLADFQKLGPKEQAEYMAAGGVLED
jgi:hypothetical protein